MHVHLRRVLVLELSEVCDLAAFYCLDHSFKGNPDLRIDCVGRRLDELREQGSGVLAALNGRAASVHGRLHRLGVFHL